MTALNKQALIAKIKKQTENFDTVVLKEDEANALLSELESQQTFQQAFFRQSLMYDVVAEAYEEAKEQIAKDVEIKTRLCLESNSLFDRLCSAEKRIAELQIARDKCFMSGLKTGWEYGIADDTEGYNREIDDAQTVIDRAAMLQAGNHTEQHLDMVVHSGDDNEKADCRLPFDQWLSQQNEPIDVDCGCVTTEAFYHWLRVAYEAGNSPVTPDGWQLVPKEPTEAMNKAGWAAINEHDAINPTYRAMLAAAPQQDVRLALEIGMSRYAGAMQKLVDSGD